MHVTKKLQRLIDDTIGLLTALVDLLERRYTEPDALPREVSRELQRFVELEGEKPSTKWIRVSIGSVPPKILACIRKLVGE